MVPVGRGVVSAVSSVQDADALADAAADVPEAGELVAEAAVADVEDAEVDGLELPEAGAVDAPVEPEAEEAVDDIELDEEDEDEAP